MDDNSSVDLKNIKFPDFRGSTIAWIVLGVFLIFFISSSFFTIEPEEVGVILRLGKYNRTVEPGLRFKIPLGIETVYKVPVQRQLKEEFGFRTLEAGVRTNYSSANYKDESLMLTGDLNAAVVEWIVQYRINEPEKFLFKVRNARLTFRDMNEAVMREIIGDRSVSEVLTIGRQEIADAAAQKLQELCNQYELGIKVDQIVLQDVTPPDEVKPAFNEVNEAQQEKEKLINQARAEYNRVIPKARGQAAKLIEEAKGYALERINQAKGDASRFNAVYKEYLKAKDVTRERIYLETMNEIMNKVGRKLITDEKASGILPLFDFSKEVKK
ncbi:MAG: FtsH protease activity modulator HflK [Candidatus Schekmanbacteria bacterium]|nr:MAG: FtsH protease activity modulator HflK [Candidatus Schekmanbacteria bacterium]